MTGWALANTIGLSIGLVGVVAGGLLGLGSSFAGTPDVAKARGNLALVFLGAGSAWIVLYALISVMFALSESP